jgi:hypothetical protein
VPLPFLFNTAIEDGKLIFTLSPNFTLSLNTAKQEVFPNLKLTATLPAFGEEFYFDFGTTKTKFKLGTTGVPQMITLTNFSSNQTWHYFATQSATVQADGNIIASRAGTYDVEVPMAAWQPFFQDYPLALTQDVSSLSVAVITQADNMIDSQPSPKQNCDVLGRGEVQKTVQNGELIYQASGKGNFCNSFYSPDINTNLNSYMVEIAADNRQGWPLSYYFYDTRGEATIWENLFYAAYDKRLFSFPQNHVPTTDKTAFTFHIINRSLSGERVENSLSLPTFYSIPTAWLTNLQLREKGAMTLRLGQDNNLQVLSSAKLGTSHYQAVVQKLSAETGVLQLAQGYHAAWQARLNGKVLPHVKVNNWANGWVVSGDQCVATACVIKISFDPQWFGWGGLVMTGVLVLLAIFAFFYFKPSSAACQNNFIFGSLKTNIKKILMGK